jgi:hypothetical protein
VRTITLLNLAEVNVRDSFSRAQVPGSPDAFLSGGFRSLEPERLHHLSTERPSSDAARLKVEPQTSITSHGDRTVPASSTHPLPRKQDFAVDKTTL